MKKGILFLVFVCCIALSQAQITIGELAPEISLPDAKGNTVTLSSFKGKIVLIDFWASWCGPCRVTNPKVVKLYNKYKASGFEVFGVSFDEKTSAWKRAIKTDKINYSQVIDTKIWEGEVAYKYGIEAIPTTFLLDKEGKIVAIDLEGKELEDAIKALL
ncbi:MAG: TlpA family protein disulfide reductase [Ferruginibacter sp.]|nr:TlpA family protein disulfide reductase [Ferruginibacter sp.]